MMSDHTILVAPPDSVSVLRSRLEALERLEALWKTYTTLLDAPSGGFTATANALVALEDWE